MMKLFASLLLTISSFLLAAQSYHPLITPGKQSSFDWLCGPCPGNMEGQIQYFFGGDTTVNSFTYKKLMYVSESLFWGKLTGVSELLREDTNAQKIYRFSGTRRDSLIGSDYKTDQLLFDYYYQVGDSVYTTFFAPTQQWIKIAAIDTITLQNQHKVRVFKQTGGTVIFTEEILMTGSEMINPGLEFYEIFFRCAQGLNGTSLYPANCTSNMYIGLEEEKVKRLEIYPNPASSIVVLNSPSIGDFELYDVLGKLVLKSSISAEEQKTLSVSNLPAGMYVWVFRTERGVEKGKLLIED